MLMLTHLQHLLVIANILVVFGNVFGHLAAEYHPYDLDCENSWQPYVHCVPKK